MDKSSSNWCDLRVWLTKLRWWRISYIVDSQQTNAPENKNKKQQYRLTDWDWNEIIVLSKRMKPFRSHNVSLLLLLFSLRHVNLYLSPSFRISEFFSSWFFCFLGSSVFSFPIMFLFNKKKTVLQNSFWESILT